MADRPNIIWVLSDQHRAQALGGFGDPHLRTPMLDGMIGAARTAVSGIPLCSPYRGSLLTGRYPHHCVPAHDASLPEGMPTIAHAFNAAGYRTAYFGKWHLDGLDRRAPGVSAARHEVPPARRGGFGCWLAYENNNAQYDCWVHGHVEGGDPVPHYKLPAYETDALTNLLLDYVDSRKAGEPFFAVLSVQPPHNPYVAPPEYLARHRPEDIQLRPNVPPVERIQRRARETLAGYYAMIENLDWNVGRIFEKLRTRNLADKTIVIYFSDHGDMHGSQARQNKCVPWEESIRVPFLVSRGTGEALLKIAEETPDLINHVDIMPTTLGLCGIPAPAACEGADYSGYFGSGRNLPEVESAYLQIVDPGYQRGYSDDRERAWRGVVTRDGWKYAVLEGQPWLLYNLNEDPFETANLALNGAFRRERQRLQDLISNWLNRTGDQFKLPDIRWVEEG